MLLQIGIRLANSLISSDWICWNPGKEEEKKKLVTKIWALLDSTFCPKNTFLSPVPELFDEVQQQEALKRGPKRFHTFIRIVHTVIS